MHKEIILKNGLKVILVPIEGVKSVTVMKMYNVGSRQEDAPISGVAHFLEHMMFKGTVKRPSAQEITVELDSIGAQYNAFTGKDITGYYVKAASEKFETAVEILSDMLYNSVFPETELEKEKGVVVEEMKVYEDQPMRYVDDIYEQMLFEGSTLANFIIGSRQTVNAMTRQQMQDFRDRFYHDHNSILCVAGSIPQNVEEILNKHWHQESTDKQKTGFVYAEFQPKQTEPRTLVFPKKVEQGHLEIGFACNGFNSDDFYTYLLLCTVMGGGMSSRLFEEMREKRGLCYYVRMSPDLYVDAGSLVIKSGVNQDKIKEAITVIIEEINKIKSGTLTEKEVQKAKDFLIGNLILELEDSAQVAETYLRQYVVTGDLLTPDQKIEKLRAVTIDDINRLAKEILVKERLNLALIATEPEEAAYKELFKALI